MAEAAVPIAFCADAHYGIYIPVILQSVLENASPARHYVICIFDCGLKAEDLALIAHMLAPYQNFTLKTYPLTEYLEENKQAFTVLEGQHLTAASYGRLFIPQLGAEFDKIIYADIDMVFNADPAALMDIPIGENYIAGAADKNIEAERQSRAGIRQYSREVLGLSDDEAYINSGILLFNAAIWREKGLVARCLAELNKRHFKRHDQDMINFICKGKKYYLSGRWNTACKLTYADENAAADKAYLCHFVGSLKPWHIMPENMPETGAQYQSARKWWAYAGKTEIYNRLRRNAALYQGRFNHNLGKQYFRVFGVPVWTVHTAPRKKKYSLFGLPIGKEVLNGKTGERVFSLAGIKLRRGKHCGKQKSVKN